MMYSMRKKLQVNYNIDKLILRFEIPEGFLTAINKQNHLAEILNPSDIFIFTRRYNKDKYLVDRYILGWQSIGGPVIEIGEFCNDTERGITLTVHNKFLYSGKLYLLHRFEELYGLTFRKFIGLEVCCDSNCDLPRKLNKTLHSQDCVVSRRGSKIPTTDKGNQYLGCRITDNIKSTADNREYSTPSFYFQLKTTGCRRPTLLRCYNKSKEVARRKAKQYILDQYDFSPVHRLEVSIGCSELTNLSKSKSGWSQQYIYEHLSDKDFLKEIFLKYLDRFATLTINGIKRKISEVLCLDLT